MDIIIPTIMVIGIMVLMLYLIINFKEICKRDIEAQEFQKKIKEGKK